jgi:hypothetical protein
MTRYTKVPAVYLRIYEWLTYSGDPRRPSAPKLHKNDMEVYERLVQLRTCMLQSGMSMQEAMAFMMTTFDISHAQFYTDYRGLATVFGDLEKENREFEKLRLKSLAMKAYRLAEIKEDSKAMSSALRNLIMLGGFDKEEPDSIDPDRLNPGAYALVLDDDTRKVLNSLVQGTGTIILNELIENGKTAEDIDFEPVTGGPDQKGD